MSLKDEILHDIDNVFMEEKDYAEWHIVDGKYVPFINDEEELKDRQGTNELDVTDCEKLIFVPQKYLPKRKVRGDQMDVDGKIYKIESWINNYGICEIALSRGVSK